MDKRELIQTKTSNLIIQNGFKGLIKIAPRVGKSKIIIDSLKKINQTINVLILAPVPHKDILNSWKSEILQWGVPDNIIITLSGTNSFKKSNKIYHLIIGDECHQYKPEILRLLKLHSNQGTCIIMMTGTLNDHEEKIILDTLKIPLLIDYSFNDAVEDGIIKDYKIGCIEVDLDSELLYVPYKGKLISEKEAYLKFTRIIEKAKLEYNQNLAELFINKRMHLLYNSVAKLKKTQSIINKLDRCLIFCCRTNIADQLISSMSYHAKSNNTDSLDLFKDQKINKLAVVGKVSMGVTFKNLNCIVFNQIQSNENMTIQKAMRAMSKDTDDFAKIYIVYAKNTQDEVWLNKAIQQFEKNKIVWR